MRERIEMNPGEWFMVAEPTILVREYETVLGDAYKIGAQTHHLACLMTFTGKVNNKDEEATTTVAMSPEDAFMFVGQILDGLELLKKEMEAGGG